MTLTYQTDQPPPHLTPPRPPLLQLKPLYLYSLSNPPSLCVSHGQAGAGYKGYWHPGEPQDPMSLLPRVYYVWVVGRIEHGIE